MATEEHIEGRLEVTKRMTSHPLCESIGGKEATCQSKKKHKSWSMPVERLPKPRRHRLALCLVFRPDGMLVEWSVVQPHRMDGTVDAELEVQRTIERAEPTASSSLLRRIVGPTTGPCGQQRKH